MEAIRPASSHEATQPDDVCGRVGWLCQVGNVSMRAFAELAGLSPSHVRLINSRARDDPRASTLLKLADVAGVSLDWLVAGRGDHPSAESVRFRIADLQRARHAKHPLGDSDDTDGEPGASESSRVVVRDGYDQTAEG